MAKRPEKSVYAFLRCGNTLVPEYDYDIKALDGVANGQRVKVEIKEFRNAARARAYWAMLHDVVEATGTVLTAERLHEVLKLENGVVDLNTASDRDDCGNPRIDILRQDERG